MQTYLLQMKFTEKGLAAIRTWPERVGLFQQKCRDMGAEETAVYLAMGPHDIVAIVEAPDDQVIARLVLSTAMNGYVTTQSTRMFPPAEFKSIIAGLP